ncbi:hypothetical protein AB1M95_07270 [Sulfitobacter sp. LCG007]
MPGAVMAQEPPLSAIDWLERNAAGAVPVALPAPSEPPVTRSGRVPEVQTQMLAESGLRQLGLVPTDVTGLPVDLWRKSDATTLARLLDTLPDLDLPAAQALLYTVLLSEAVGPRGDAGGTDVFTLARVHTLVRFGALEPALALIELAGPTRDEAHFTAYMDTALLTGDEDAACELLVAYRQLAPSLAHNVFCTARTGDWSTAALLYETGRATGAIDATEAALLDRFLNPDLYENAPPIPPPATITPLKFRLHETIGEALPTGSLPRAYAVADLRDLAGWKAQLEAAERLTRTGALPDNRLLGIYTARLPAASGGIWDRVEALQQFDTALSTNSADAVSKTLPPAWSAMREAGLETSFSELYAGRLAAMTLEGESLRIAYHMRMLSSGYEQAAQDDGIRQEPVAQGIALGHMSGLRVDDPVTEAIQNGFEDRAVDPALVRMAGEGKLGEAILRTLRVLAEGTNGDTKALGNAIGTLRKLGLEDTARRAGLEIVLLERLRG